jgi:hypothetical protein
MVATPEKVVKTVRESLLATGRAKTWGLDAWSQTRPLYVPGSSGDYAYGFTAVFEIVNDSGGKNYWTAGKGIPVWFSL